MGTVKTDSLNLAGPWVDGHVLERQHTISSDFLGYDSNGHAQFDTQRSELGELVFRLKNRNDKNSVPTIAETAAAFVSKWGVEFDAVVPVPPSRRRAFQPVVEIAEALGSALSKPVLTTALVKARETPELKDVFDYGERQRLLNGAVVADAGIVVGKRLLLVDDLYRSGATAAVATEALIAAGADAVYFLAMTKTRTRS